MNNLGQHSSLPDKNQSVVKLQGNRSPRPEVSGVRWYNQSVGWKQARAVILLDLDETCVCATECTDPSWPSLYFACNGIDHTRIATEDPSRNLFLHVRPGIYELLQWLHDTGCLVVVATMAGCEYAKYAIQVLFGSRENQKPWFPSLVATVSAEAFRYQQQKIIRVVAARIGFNSAFVPSASVAQNPFPCPVVTVDDNDRNYAGNEETYRIVVEAWIVRDRKSPVYDTLRERITACIDSQS